MSSLLRAFGFGAALLGWTALDACSSADDAGGGVADATDTGAAHDAGSVSAFEAGPAEADDTTSETLDATVSHTDDGGMSCVKGMYTAKARPLDMFILLDQSGSMQEDEDRWTPVTKAIKTFVSAPGTGRTGVALQYFPLGTDDSFKCLSASYQVPDVAMGELPQQAQAIVSSIDAHFFSHDECCDTPEHAGTPTRPALEGAVAYMKSFMQKNPEHVGVILLATDGEPSSVCDDNKASRVAEVVEGAAQGTPAIRTYVIGIGDDEYLDDMAAPGGTGRGPFIVDGTGKNTEQELLQALSEIRNEALPCDYAVDNVADTTRLNVETLRGTSATPTTLVNVANRGACSKAAATGWYFDDPKAPKRVHLCPETCSALSLETSTSLRIVEGCQTVVLL